MEIANGMRIIFLMLALLLTTATQVVAQRSRNRKPSADTTAKAPAPESIESIIKSTAKRHSGGMITLYEDGGKHYFLIPQTLLGRDMLVVNRLSKAAADMRSNFSGYAGDQINNVMIRLEKSPDDKRIFVRQILTSELLRDTVGTMHEAVLRSNIQPIVQSFEIKARNAGRDSLLIETTDFLNGDSELIGFNADFKDEFSLTNFQSDKSYILDVHSYPMNTEIKTVKTFMTSFGEKIDPAPATYQINSSIILLPEKPMQPRYSDPRVGYFSQQYTDYEQNPQGVKNVKMITRWRLEPKDEDMERYARGELVEPKKPIVYYIDPATPDKWVDYLIQGVNDWEPVFRKAGFKNAIRAMRAPVEDSTWSLEDARYSAIVYKPSKTPNASGPHVGDPRSGEILESHINWYHNVMQLLRNWYMIQVGPNDPRAQQMVFPDELMGELIRFVSSHEVGHTLGLRHNFGATSLTPVDSLRSRDFLQKYGHTPSIMDYSRFNYVVQPEDGIEPELQYPRIGDYDKWAIEWGYRRFPEFDSPTAELPYLNTWIIEKQKNPRLWFGHEINANDPRSQAEDLGDNQMLANELGILNLKRVMADLPQWTTTPNEGFANLAAIYGEVIGQYNRYMGHATKWIGGIYEDPVTVEQADHSYRFVEKHRQQQAMKFLDTQLFNTPTWLLDHTIFEKTSRTPSSVMSDLYASVLSKLLSRRTLGNLIDAQNAMGAEAYSMADFYKDLNRSIFRELSTGDVPDAYRRALQKQYITALIDRSGLDESSKGSIIIYGVGTAASSGNDSDIESYALYELRELHRRLTSAVVSDPMTKAHYQYLALQINRLLK